MDSYIYTQKENINKSLRWIKEYHPEHYEQRFLQLMEERRKLRILDNVQRNNPGIAAFGQSQVGKSYLMNCILQDNGNPFMVDAEGRRYNFVDEINPIGDGRESTGVVTRFSAYHNHVEEYNEKYPIRFRSLNVHDIILIICDTFFNDFRDQTTYGEEELREKCEQLSERYAAAPVCKHTAVTPDDLLDIKWYIRKHCKSEILSNTILFDQLALMIDRIPLTDYADVFSLLWHGKQEFTDLFCQCLDILQRMQFSEYVYLPIESVLHNGKKDDTIMSVSCLMQLGQEEANKHTTHVYVKEGDKKETVMRDLGVFTKSELCAVCAEVVIRIGEDFINSKGNYDIRDIRPENLQKLPSDGVATAVLKENDLLDFPGARPRNEALLSLLTGEKRENVMESFLRGKVAYLFNKYTEEKLINILLYCHHNANLDAKQMWRLLNEWVIECVGNTPEKRAEFLQKTEVPPLFYIGTMFNKDLKPSDNSTVGDQENAISDRWKGRFDMLELDCFRKKDVEWVGNWTGKNQPFQNGYMLRDFKFSKDIYEQNEECKEVKMHIDREYYERMRNTFIESNKTYNFFADAGLSWDVSASIGNDGSLYIIEQLSKVAEKILAIRESQMSEQLKSICINCFRILNDYYVSSDTDELLKSNISKANGIFREMEFTCQSHPEYFGHLIQALQLTEAESFKEIHRLVPELISTVNDSSVIKDYELIRKRCDNFEGCSTEGEKWERFVSTYRFMSREEALEYLRMRQIDVEKLFQGEKLKRKNSAVIVHDMMLLWQKRISGMQFIGEFTGNGLMDNIVMTNLVNCLLATAQHIQLTERLESEIADYVDVLNISSINEDLVADMIATTISDFVIDWGYRYLPESQRESARSIARDFQLPCFNWIDKERKEHFEEEEMTEVFNDILSSAERYTPSYIANYNSWLEFMFVAFIAHIQAPNFDRVANEKLKELLDEIKIK